MWFQRYESAPTFHWGSPRNSLQSDIFWFGPGIFIRWMQPTFDILCLTCPCQHRNDQLSASWQDYFRCKLLTAATISNFWGVHWVHIRASQKYWNLPWLVVCLVDWYPGFCQGTSQISGLACIIYPLKITWCVFLWRQYAIMRMRCWMMNMQLQIYHHQFWSTNCQKQNNYNMI